MRQKEAEALYQYILNNIAFLEDDVIQLRQNFRYRQVDAVDCIELCLALERLQAFQKFSSDVTHILKIKGSSED